MPLQIESFISAMVVCHDQNYQSFTHEERVASFMFAASVLGYRHWTVDFLVPLLQESVIKIMRNGVVAASAALMCLSRFRIVWARSVNPDAELTSGFVGWMQKSVRGLSEAGCTSEAASLASEVLGAHIAVWGELDEDTLMLAGLASQCQQPFDLRFDWSNCVAELRPVLDCTSNGSKAAIDSHFSRLCSQCPKIKGAAWRAVWPPEHMEVGPDETRAQLQGAGPDQAVRHVQRRRR